MGENGVALELLRFAWKPNELRLLMAGLADSGPTSRAMWSRRTGIPRNHLAAVMAECERLGGCKVAGEAEGLTVNVQPVVFWRVTPMCEPREWAFAWQGVGQEKLSLSTEMPSLSEAMAVGSDFICPQAPGFRESWHPDSGSVKRSELTVDRLPVAFNVERLKSPDSGRQGWIEPETEDEAMQACSLMLGGTEEMRVWGGRWRNRWRRNADGLRKILNMVREDKAIGRKPKDGSNWGRYANDLWKRFIETSNDNGKASMCDRKESFAGVKASG